MDNTSSPEPPDVVSPEILVDINTASQRKLLKLPGIGRALATQIQAARPFTSVDDLLRVPGITREMVEKLRPFAIASQPTPPIPAESTTTPPIVLEAELPQTEESVPSPAGMETELQVEAEPALTTETEGVVTPSGEESKAEVKSSALVAVSPLHYDNRYVKIEQAVWMAIGSGLISLILALFFTLGILTAINGSLRFVTKSEMVPLKLDLDSIKTQADTLNQDLKGIRQRLDNLEGMSGRMNVIETSVKDMQSEVQSAIEQVNGMSEKVEQLNKQAGEVQNRLETIQAETSRYQLFLDGLRDLLDRIIQTQGTQR